MYKIPYVSGDLPSKTGFSLLEHHGLARRNTTTWIACITDAGLNLFKELTWRNGQVTGKEIIEALEREREEDSGVRVVECRTVKGNTVATLVGKK